ncbi:MAG: peptide-methionine (R)-S-oxide reductase, partial [Candidatus Omnitrophica bacterium]|nr:peptide-methionine (R)-S-oxide reductase [Candidatus Omnitrophota bacterium]
MSLNKKTAGNAVPIYDAASGSEVHVCRIQKTNEEWARELPPTVYRVTREGRTERPFSGKYLNHHETGVYRCAACGADLFPSDTKFDSGTGGSDSSRSTAACHSSS